MAMAPYTFGHASGTIVTLLVGFFFGFVLERAGFGNAHNLAAQFYFRDMRVLKVMFTAIVTAMLLLFLASAVGLVDFARVWVPPTYLWPGLLGGFILGVGFILAGYCPGTSLVAGATLKLDGLVCAAGVLFGLVVFGETAPAFWGFFNNAGAMGRVTLFDALGVDAGVIVLGVVVMAVGAFAFAEMMERIFAVGHVSNVPGSRRLGLRPDPISLGDPAPVGTESQRGLGPVGTESQPTDGGTLETCPTCLRRLAVAAAVGIAVITLAIGQPTVERKIAWASKGLEQSIRERKIHIDPAELLALMHNQQAQVVLADVRSQSDYNLFHLLDARNVSLRQIDSGWAAGVPSGAVVVVMSNDEQAADEAWKHLAVQLNPDPQLPVAGKSRVYVLAGGVNRWLDIYQEGQAGAPGPETAPSGDDACRHPFPLALGSREPAARPELDHAPQRKFVAKVQAVKPVHHAAGGCG